MSTYDFGISGATIEVHDVSTTSQIDTILKQSNYFYTIDYTEDICLQGHLQTISSTNEQFNFVFGQFHSGDFANKSHTFHGLLTNDYLVKIMCETAIPLFPSHQIALLISPSALRYQLTSKVRFWTELFKKTVFLSSNQETIKRQIGAELKAEGIPFWFILTNESEEGVNIIQSMEQKFMDRTGFNVGIISESLHILLNSGQTVDNELLRTGLTFLVEEGVEAAASMEEVQALKIKKLMELLELAKNDYGILTEQNLLDSCFNQDHTMQGYLSVCNSQYGQVVKIGRFNHEEFEISEQLYPGGSSSLDWSSNIKIDFSLYSSLNEMFGDFLNAANLAKLEVEQKEIIPNGYQLYAHTILINEQLQLSDEQIDQILHPTPIEGVNIALYGIWTDDIIQQIYDYQKEHGENYTVQLYPYSLSGDYADLDKYPYFNPSQYTGPQSAYTGRLFMDFNSWKKTSFIYDKSSIAVEQGYEQSMAELTQNGIQVLGTSEQHGFSAFSTKTEFLASKKDYLDEIIESRFRYAHMYGVLSLQINWALEYFYEEGMRVGDIIVNMPDTPWVQMQLSDLESNEPLKQLFDYGVNLITPLAESISEEIFYEYVDNYVKQYDEQPSVISTWFYDGMYHFAQGLQSTIVAGKDYEIPEVLNLYMRQVRFNGWTGIIAFDTETNLRKLLGYSIFQFRWREDVNDFAGIMAGHYSPHASPFYLLEYIEWPDDSLPSEMRPLYKNCAFEKYEISDSDFGKLVLYGACLGILIYAWIIIYGFLYIYRGFQVEEIKSTYIGMGDFITGLILVFEFLQLISLAPFFINEERYAAIQQISVYPMNYLDIQEDIIQQQIYLSFVIEAGTIATVVILCVNQWQHDIIFIIKILFTIGFGFVLYIPNISMIMDIFACTEQVDGDPFFDIDCNSDCWDDQHRVLICYATFAILLHIVAGIFIRMKLQETLTDLNLLWCPKFIIIKTGIISCMTVLSKMFVQYPYVQIASLCVGMLMIVVLTVVVKPYNYKRIDLYAATLGSIYIGLICISTIPLSTMICELLACTYVLILGVVCLYIQHKYRTRFPKMLANYKSHNITDMIRFQFLRRDTQICEGKSNDEFIENITHRLSFAYDQNTQVYTTPDIQVKKERKCAWKSYEESN